MLSVSLTPASVTIAGADDAALRSVLEAALASPTQQSEAEGCRGIETDQIRLGLLDSLIGKTAILLDSASILVYRESTILLSRYAALSR